ncbi:hypothetical protein Back2_08400 [Nocardioides baekrokdamisoli]|uniref:Mechanosensitive ion channel protein MscS n=1 Tax=Nocardioides baekrokdamisoli TaxID=1804624 RepID=A0A3G9IW26_9ACTN|nr:mechanosensitive ion channel domain-containing protein [Nocardioides baekrokdamisoli]BBH16553.1 hypothetical protein Back2_08400 [Nocardioides baekrokdamisoli]
MTALSIDHAWHRIWTIIQERPGTIAGLVILAFVVRWVVLRLVNRFVTSTSESAAPLRSARLAQRARTIGGLARSLATWVIVAIFGIMLLDQMGINVAPLIAGAGVVGIAVGFGAQTLVKDYFNGVFMILEDQYSVGDRVELETPQLNTSGVVEAVSLRVTRVRDDSGKIVYIRNGEILRVSNLTQGDVAPDIDDPTD